MTISEPGTIGSGTGGTSRTISKVLVANRGEIAVRVIRAAADAGLGSVAVYAEPDADGLFVRLADEAYALGGATPADSYLDVDKVLAAATRSGADAVHPGYGFLAENADFARAVIDAGLIWIGPPSAAIEKLGDKVQARHIAQAVGAPLVPGTADPVADAAEVLAFADEHGLPIAIKAAHGGGGRGLKVARDRDEIPELFESATREATAAFGRGECFVERYLDRPRHVETQCLADAHGTVVVVSTRDCSLQRRHQKLVEEAPAPFLTDEQLAVLYRSSKAILAEAGYVGAGTCEFLVGTDGTISFLEVNTRLQVEHPVSEEVTGLDLVREQFRIADGEELGYADPRPRGHSIEFRINAEDPGRGFLPAPGTLASWQPPAGPGVRVDEGYRPGQTVPGAFDSLIAKVVVTGANRPKALARARRALAELEVTGMPTVVPFHRAVLDDPAFTADDSAGFGVHTRWIETEFTGRIPPYEDPTAEQSTEPVARETVVVEVNGKRVEVSLPAGLGATGGNSGARKRPVRRRAATSGPAPSSRAITSPMQGTIVKVAVGDGDRVAAGDLVVVLEAMKMEQPLTAHRDGVVSGLSAGVGATVASGAVICEIVDPD
ncbi:acetyl/propionyl/methylcrotonyl-CoA carboxylase subunit alpha [Propionibacteriaceae bacterium Y2011]